MTKLIYYIVPTYTHTKGHAHMFASWAAIDNEDGTSLLSVRFHSDDLQDRFEALDGVQPLPALKSGQKVNQGQAKHLAHLHVTTNDTIDDVRAKAKGRYRAM